MAIQVVEFSSGDHKIRKVFANDSTQRKLLNFKNYVDRELSEIGHHFSNKGISKLMLSKTVNDKNWCSSKKKENEKNSDDF